MREKTLRTLSRLGLCLAAVTAIGTGALAQDLSVGPDVVYSDCTSVQNWGAVGTIRAYTLGSNTCNIGNVNLDWASCQAGAPCGTTPLLAMHAYRLMNGRLEQIGISFVKNGTVAAAGTGCGLPCNGQGGTWLGAGCRDIYGASYNGGQSILGSRSSVNAFTGEYPGAAGGGGNAIFKRLQCNQSDLNLLGALYFIEGHYVAYDDASSGNAMNNCSYKRVTMDGSFNMAPAGAMDLGTPAIYAWHDHGNGVGMPDDSVNIVAVDVPGEGRFHVAAQVKETAPGQYRYEYAVHNLNSHRSARAFSVPMPASATVSNIGFHDVFYHSGDPYDNTDWGGAVTTGGAMLWSSPQTFEENANTNALRWGTMYNFWFDCNVAPEEGFATITLFRPGTPGSVDAPVMVPGGSVCTADVNGDGTVDVQDLTQVILNWGPCPGGCPADITGDDRVLVDDLTTVILNWGPCGAGG